MRVPLEWLADYVELELPVEDLAHRLTMSGLKVEAIERTGADWQDIRVGHVLSAEPHPRSNKPLTVARVSTGDREVTVVTGAPNVRQGDKAPLVLVGGSVPHGPDGLPLRIEPRPMAGITSEGMLASARELGISDEHAGILILPPDTPVGVPLATVLGGVVLDLETNPNRPDTLSMIGVAREVAAITGCQLTLPDLDAVDGVAEWVDRPSAAVDVLDPDLCPRYTALRIAGVQAGESPAWLARRLQAAGMRPINLLVDLTNYVMLEFGQPMHAFDARQLEGDHIVVRRAEPDELLVTLDGTERRLGPDNLVIADGTRPVAVAGVMGGENSEIAGDTTELVLESATFDPISVRRTAQALGLRTEASIRFEKGLAPEQAPLGIRRYLQLLAQVAPGSLTVYRVTDQWVGPVPDRKVLMPLRDLHRLVGLDIAVEQAEEALSLLGFEVERHTDGLTVTVPSWRRVDIEQSADVVEEVARLIGFDAVPATLPPRTMSPVPLPAELRWELVVRDRLLAAGVSECVTHSLTAAAHTLRLVVPGGDEPTDEEHRWQAVVVNPAGVYAREACTLPVELANWATRDRQMLRLSLLPGLLEVVSRNLKQTDERLAFFEMGRTFFRRPEYRDLPYERRTLGIALSGRRRPRSWQEAKAGPYTFFDLKGLIAGVLQSLGIEEWSTNSTTYSGLHPGRAATVRVAGQDVAVLGQLHPLVAAEFELEAWPVQVAEIDLDALMERAVEDRSYRSLPRYPAAYRDLAVVVEQSVPVQRVLDIVRAEGDELLESAEVFDVHTGPPLPAQHKSVAVGMSFRAPGTTLTQEEVAAVSARILNALTRELGAVLRD